MKQGRLTLLIIAIVCCLSGCFSSLWTGASLVYDRHDVYKKLDDYHLLVAVNNAVFSDKYFKNPQTVIDVAVFNGDLLLAGHVANTEMAEELHRRLQKIKGYRRIYNKVIVSNKPSTSLEDTWITTKIRSQIFADSSIDPNAFKVITSDGVVYLMGDVKHSEADKVITIARYTQGVSRVVKILKYFKYETAGAVH